MASFLDSLQGGVQFGQGLKQSMNRDKISALAGQAYGATDPAQRQAAIGQAIGLDAGQGFQVEGQLDQTEDRRTKTMVNMAKLLTSVPEQARPALYAKMVPTLGQFGLSELPPVYDQTTAPTIMGAAKSIVSALGAATGEEIPTQFRAIDMQLRAAGYEPGTPEYQQGMRIATGQEGRAASGGFSFEMFEGPDGKKRPGRRNPRDGSIEVFSEQVGDFVPLGGATQLNTGSPTPQQLQNPQAVVGSLPPLGADMLPIWEGLVKQFPGTQITSTIRTPDRNNRVGGVTNSQHLARNGGTAADFVVPDSQKAAFKQMAAQVGLEAIDEGDHIHLERPPARTQVASNGLGVSRTAEEEAAAVARAKGGVELDLLPQTKAIERDSAIQQAVGIEAGKITAEKAAAAPAIITTLQNSLDSIDALVADPNLDDIVGIGSLNPLNRVPGTKARGLIARADQIAGQSFLAAFNQLKGGGAITEREGQAATQAIARLDRSQSAADYKQALTDLRAAIKPGLERAKQQAQGAPRTAERRARNPQTGETLVLRNGQWVPE